MPKKDNYRNRVQAIMNQYMDNMRKREAYEMVLLSKRWEQVIGSLENLIKSLSELPIMTPNQLIRLSIYKEFMNTANYELVKYASYSANVISSTQLEFAKNGLNASYETLSLFNVSFNKLPFEAVTQMIGKTQDGSPLAEVLLKRYGDSIEKATQILIESNAMGRNPLVTARLIGEDINGSLYNTIRIARTEQIDSFREASRAGYIESGIVKGLNLVPEPDACPICLGVAEKNPYPLDYGFDELHPNCRCPFSPEL